MRQDHAVEIRVMTEIEQIRFQKHHSPPILDEPDENEDVLVDNHVCGKQEKKKKGFGRTQISTKGTPINGDDTTIEQ